MAKQKQNYNVEIAPALKVVLTKGQKFENLVNRIRVYLKNEKLGEARMKFKLAAEEAISKEGEMSYTIKWNGYEMMMAEKIERELFVTRKFIDDLIVGYAVQVGNETMLDGIVAAMEKQFKKEYDAAVHRLVNQDWLIEWDSSTCPFSNQEKKAEARAVQEFAQTMASLLRPHSFFQQTKKN